MLIYFSGISLDTKVASELKPSMRKWIKEAAANNNVDAIHEKVIIGLRDNKYGRNDYLCPEYDIYDFEVFIPTLEYAGSLGSADAMMLLAGWYDKVPSTYKDLVFSGGNDSEKALKWFNNAALAGSPNAMYYLGVIYKYGCITSKSFL